MDSLLARYFDGELDDREAKAFLENVESNPKMEAELRAYEQILTLGKKLPGPKAPPGFTNRVMSEIKSDADTKPLWTRLFGNQIPRAGLAAAAASILFAFIVGWWAGQDRTIMQGISDEPSSSVSVSAGVSPGSITETAAASTGLHYVRLAYIPSDPSVERVTVAGSFNNWDPDSTPLRLKNGAWITVLVLPPGSYEYMFIEDNNRWVTDPLAEKTRDDGFGSVNAVLDVAI